MFVLVSPGLHQQLKKGIFSKGVLAEIACNVILPSLGCSQRVHESSAKRCLVQNVGCCDANAPQGTKILDHRIGARRAQCRGGSAVHSALQGSAENWRSNFRHFPTFSAPLVLQCLTSRMWETQFPTISAFCRKFSRKFPHCGGAPLKLERGWVLGPSVAQQGPFRATHLNTNVRRAATGRKRRGTWAQESQILRNYPFSKNPFLQLLTSGLFPINFHTQCSRHSSPILDSWSQFLFAPILCLRGRPKYSNIQNFFWSKKWLDFGGFEDLLET